MKHTMKKTLALLIALLLAMPPVTLAEDLDIVLSSDIEPPVEEAASFDLGDDEIVLSGEIELEDLTIDLLEDAPEEVSGDLLGEPAQAAPFDQSVELEAVAAVEPQSISVVFDATPETATITVYPAVTEEVPEPEAIPVQEDGSFLLLPGEYTYTAEAEGYVSVEAVPFTVADEPPTLSVTLEPVVEEEPEPVAFCQSKIVSGVVVKVQADAGVFPANAALSVKRVPVKQRRAAENAIDELRDEDVNVAVSYTFDIKVINPDTGEEYQPAEGQTVNVSFALAEVADENLETQVYHVTEEETTGELTAEALDVTTEVTPETGEETTATVETDGFSIYQVEFTYNKLEYVLPGDSSVAMSEILSALGLTGEVTAVKISDTSLFSASNENGAWIVTAHQAFSTTEWMKVTINGVVYEITVTDDGFPDITIPEIKANITVNIIGNGTVKLNGTTVTSGQSSQLSSKETPHNTQVYGSEYKST